MNILTGLGPLSGLPRIFIMNRDHRISHRLLVKFVGSILTGACVLILVAGSSYRYSTAGSAESRQFVTAISMSPRFDSRPDCQHHSWFNRLEVTVEKNSSSGMSPKLVPSSWGSVINQQFPRVAGVCWLTSAKLTDSSHSNERLLRLLQHRPCHRNGSILAQES
jgi:hypothetical protein